MTWPQIYDVPAVATEYGVVVIPCPVLVDGDTGIILVAGLDALDPKNLTQKIETALAAKAKLEKIAPDVNQTSSQPIR
jgi:hypothetical protein